MNRITLERVAIWTPFFLLFAFFWRVYDLFGAIPNYGDALEVIWGILWYNNALSSGVNPLFYSKIFHPEGWQVGILAHTPFLFLIAQPIYAFTNAVFAYNVITIASFFVAYSGALRFFRALNIKFYLVIVIALLYTFVTMRSEKVWGHLHILWATSILPWLAYMIIRWKHADPEKRLPLEVWLCGLLWGGMLSFSLYSLFLALPLFLLLGNKLRTWQTWVQLIVVGGAAAVVGSHALIPYALATRIEPVVPPSFESLVSWGADLNAMFSPSRRHIWPELVAIAFRIRGRGFSEADSHNMGLTTLLPLFVGLFFVRRKQLGPVLLMVGVSLILAIGPVFKTFGEALSLPLMGSLNTYLWGWGYFFKPEVFVSETPPIDLANAIPAPGYLMTIFVPFWEGARVSARFSLVAYLGLLAIVATGFEHMPRWLAVILLAIWLVEMWPMHTRQSPLDVTNLHPAYQWVNDQTLNAEDGIIDVREQILHGGEPLLSSIQTKVPTASAIGSFLPAQSRFLFVTSGNWLDLPPNELRLLLRSYDVRFILVHDISVDGQGRPIFEHLMSHSNIFDPQGCFDSISEVISPWAYTICVFEIDDHPSLRNAHPTVGWGELEPWGMWMTSETAVLRFVATQKTAYRGSFEAFPHCIDGMVQSVSFDIDDEPLHTYTWNACETMNVKIDIPVERISIGWNELTISTNYAISPADLNQSGDQRRLSIGINRLKIEKQDNDGSS